MKIKKNLDISTDDFWYDLTKGGYLKPEDICENISELQEVQKAIRILLNFEQSCEEQIEGFIQ